tara:strand:- start:2819 stop:4162 length:1344 start_codon:yes stop_codon:yes gene_type:complete
MSTLLPASPDVENEVLGACLVHNEVVSGLVSKLVDEDFHTPKNKLIWRGLSEAHRRHGKFDDVVLKEVMEDLGLWSQVGGWPVLTKLVDRNGTTARVEEYVQVLKTMSTRRRIWNFSSNVATVALDGDLTGEEAVNEVDRQVTLLRNQSGSDNTVDAQAAVKDYMSMIHDIQRGELQPQRISSGINALDRTLGGGFRPGWSVLVMSLNGHGKTALAVNGFAWEAAKQNRPVLVVSLEMPPEQLIARLIAAESGIPVTRHDQPGLDAEELSRLSYAADQVSTKPIRVVGHSASTIEGISNAARMYKAEKGDLGMVVVDYIQLMRSEKASVNRVEELEKASRGLKELAMELECVCVCLSQPVMSAKRAATRPTIRDSKGSGAIDDDADLGLVPWLPHNVDDAAPKTSAEIGMDKFRHGMRRDLGEGDIEWNGTKTRFMNAMNGYGSTAY